jgi:oxalate decarboxylase/phosphoglucose isomerase-like protein (cupin superfamily)
MKHATLFTLLTAAAAPALVRATAVADQLQGLKGANTAVDRIAVLKDDSDFVFNFLDPGNKRTKGAGGEAIGAAVGNFPALFGSGIAMTLGFMQPCSMNSPHTHPRATEVLLVVNGTEGIQSGFLAENGARFVLNTIHPYQATVFPRGSIHFQANLGCDPVMFVATLNDEDPGTLQVAQRFFALPADVVGPALGGLGVKEVSELSKLIPDNLATASDACFKKCGLTPPAKGAQPTSQQQTAAPAPTKPAGGGGSGDSTGNHDTFEDKGTPLNWLANPDPNASESGDGPKHNVLAAADDGDGPKSIPSQAKEKAEAWFADLPHDGTKIALLIVAILNVALLIGGIVFCCVRASKQRKLRKNGGMEAMTTTTSGHVSKRSISAPRPLLAGAGSSRGKYEAAQYELPLDDAASVDTMVATTRKYDDPYDRPASRAPSPLPQAHSGPYRD